MRELILVLLSLGDTKNYEGNKNKLATYILIRIVCDTLLLFQCKTKIIKKEIDRKIQVCLVKEWGYPSDINNVSKG